MGEGSLEGDLAAIEDGTGASFTVGSSPTARVRARPVKVEYRAE
jgi:hypothetical protein